MAKKINANLAKQLKALNINAKTEEEARKKLLEILEKEGVEGMDDEDTEVLIEMVETFIKDEDEEEDVDDEAEEDSDEEEAEDLADEAEEEESETEEDDDSDEDEEEDVDDEAEEDSDEEEAEDLADEAKTTAKKEVVKKPAKKAEKEEKKPAKKVSKRGVKLDLKNSEDDRKELSKLMKMFKEDYSFAWLSGSGLTVKHVGKNGNRGIFTIDNVTKLDDGTIRCNLYLVTMTKETDKLTEMGIDFEKCWTGAPCMKGISLDEVIEILEKVYDTITSFATTVDKRLGENRKKMEENLKNSGKKKTEAKAKKVEEEEVEEEDDEDEEEEEVKPVKKAKTTKKKVAKKAKK